MKYIVNELPKSSNKCPMAEWFPYPPIVEKTGDYKCMYDKKVCDLHEKGCRWLKQEEKA